MKKFKELDGKHLFIIRNTIYARNLQKKKMISAIDELREINKTLRYFQELAAKRKDMLVLVSSASSVGIEFPQFGKDWLAFEKSGKECFVQKKQSLGHCICYWSTC
jgi:hypothetical protein